MRVLKRKCSFCHRSEDQVTKLVAGRGSIMGPRPFICDRCVAIADTIMRGAPIPPPGPAAGRPVPRHSAG